MILITIFLAINVDSLIEINEIMYDPEGNDNDKEFIEIYSDENKNLTNYTIEDLSGGKDILVLRKYFNSNYSLIVEDGFDYSNINASIYTIGATIGNNLNNDNEIIILKDNQDKIVDIVNYFDSFGANNNGKSLERISIEDYSNNMMNWRESYVLGGTPGKDNSVFNLNFNDLIITEFLPNPEGDDDANAPGGEFVELYNNLDYKINLEGFNLQDDFGHKIMVTNVNSNAIEINSKSFSVIYMNGFSGFLNNDFDKIKLFYGNKLIDEIIYENSKEGFSWSKINNLWKVLKPSPGEENKEEIINNGKSSLKINKIYLGKDDEASFGDSFEARLEIYKGNTSKNAIDVWVEDDGIKVSRVSNFNIYTKFQNYTINIPVLLNLNCNYKYPDGKYYVIAEGLDLKDKKEIEINDINNKLCNIKEENKKIVNNEINYEFIEIPNEINSSENINIKLKINNNSTEDKNIEISSYVYKGRSIISRDKIEKRISLPAQSSILFDLDNKLDSHVVPGEYKLKINFKEEGKRADDFTTNIRVVENQEKNYNNTNNIQGRLIYESSDVKAKNSVPLIMILTLLIIVIFLVFRKGL